MHFQNEFFELPTIEFLSYEWETFMVMILYSRNFECFYRDYDTATVTIRRGKFSTHTKMTLLTTVQRRCRLLMSILIDSTD